MRSARAGSLESGDCLVTIEPSAPGTGVELVLESSVMYCYGIKIREVVEDALRSAACDVHVSVIDRGAMDFVIRARIETALSRARSGGDPR